MSPQPETGLWKIISLVKDEPVPAAGVNDTKPTFQPVRLNEPLHVWSFTQQAGYFVFRFAIPSIYPYTGVEEYESRDKSLVIATTDETKDVKWNLIYREANSAYTISPESDLNVGWTVDSDISTNPEISIAPLLPTASDSPQFSATQLFTFEKVG